MDAVAPRRFHELLLGMVQVSLLETEGDSKVNLVLLCLLYAALFCFALCDGYLDLGTLMLFNLSCCQWQTTDFWTLLVCWRLVTSLIRLRSVSLLCVGARTLIHDNGHDHDQPHSDQTAHDEQSQNLCWQAALWSFSVAYEADPVVLAVVDRQVSSQK